MYPSYVTTYVEIFILFIYGFFNTLIFLSPWPEIFILIYRKCIEECSGHSAFRESEQNEKLKWMQLRKRLQ